MTIDEARKVAYVVSFADGGCPGCVGDLVTRLNEEFPEFHWRKGGPFAGPRVFERGKASTARHRGQAPATPVDRPVES